MSLSKRAGCLTESKALEKSIVDRIVRDPGLGLLNLPKWTEKATGFDQEWTVQGGNWHGEEKEWN